MIDYKIAIEIEGGVWAGGRHVHPTGFIKDMEKYNELSASGWLLLRTQPKKIMGLVPLIDRMIK